jgi:hypothetical protein
MDWRKTTVGEAEARHSGHPDLPGMEEKPFGFLNAQREA